MRKLAKMLNNGQRSLRPIQISSSWNTVESYSNCYCSVCGTCGDVNGQANVTATPNSTKTAGNIMMH